MSAAGRARPEHGRPAVTIAPFDDPVVSLREAAAAIGVSEQTLRNWRSKGKGPESLKIGGLVRYRASALAHFLDEARQPPAEG